jgi:hypothetical protein
MPDFLGNDYSKFTGLADMPYNIISYLLNNNDNLWKMIYYNDSDCLFKDNLTIDQKTSLIYNGQTDSSTYRMFMIDMVDDIVNTEYAFVKVFEAVITPNNRIVSTINFQIDVFCHNKINQMSNYQPRTLRMKQEVLSTLNGANIGGLGYLSFDQVSSRRDISLLNLSNSKEYSGYSILMHTNMGKG